MLNHPSVLYCDIWINWQVFNQGFVCGQIIIPHHQLSRSCHVRLPWILKQTLFTKTNVTQYMKFRLTIHFIMSVYDLVLLNQY